MDKILKCIEDLGEGKYVCYKTRKVALDVNDQDILDYDDKPVVQTHDSRFAESDQTRVKTVTISKRMIEMCNKGKIDLIITKSISRFARNTVDCLTHVRKLKANNIGVIFEKEGINTLAKR